MYINESDFSCKCCGEVDIDGGFITILAGARERARIPFRILRGYVCEKEATRLGLRKDHPSCKGLACFIEADNAKDRKDILEALILSRFNRINLWRNAIYVDMSNDEPQDLYGMMGGDTFNPDR